MLKGAIGFSRSNSFISKAIRWFRKSTISHTFIMITNENDEILLVLEAGKRQVQITSYYKYYGNKKKCHVELYVPNVSEEKINEAIIKMIPYLDKGYGYSQLLGFALVSVLKWIGIKIKNPIKWGIICSELVRDFGILLGCHKFAKLDRDTTAPDDLLKIIKKSSKFKKIERP